MKKIAKIVQYTDRFFTRQNSGWDGCVPNSFVILNEYREPKYLKPKGVYRDSDSMDDDWDMDGVNHLTSFRLEFMYE